MKLRKVELAVISDTHLGTYGCHAAELLNYLKSIDAETLILNGDIIDMWQFNKRYFPQDHMRVIKHLTGLIAKGKRVFYITGNHDELLRKFEGFEIGNFKIVNKVVLNLNGKKAWFFHGDVFDVTMQHSKWLAMLGATGYDTLILINRFVNYISEKWLNKGKLSLSKQIKNSVKSAVKFINNFEQTASEIAIKNGYEYVICGHIHQPEMKEIKTELGKVHYLNSGDWIENLTALEYQNNTWRIVHYNDEQYQASNTTQTEEVLESKLLFEQMLSEFRILETELNN